MRISDWSSDVCSSDLTRWWRTFQHVDHLETHQALGVRCTVLVSIPLPAQVCTVPATIRRILPGPEPAKIGRASCRERVCQYVSISVVAVTLKNKNSNY